MKSYFKKRRSLLLLEVLIAFALVALCVLPLIYPHIFIYRSERAFVQKVELDHLVNVLFAKTLQELYQNEISWNDIESGRKIEVEDEVWEALGYKQGVSFKGYYQFTKMKQKPKNLADVNAFLFKLSYIFTPKVAAVKEVKEEASKQIIYHYVIPIEYIQK